MLLKHMSTHHLVEVDDLTALTNPFTQEVTGQFLWGEEIQEPEKFNKLSLSFPSGEQLPHCWWDAHYQEEARILHRPTATEGTPGYYGA
ncbi:acetyltransferase [Marinobacter sp. 1Y8]